MHEFLNIRRLSQGNFPGIMTADKTPQLRTEKCSSASHTPNLNLALHFSRKSQNNITTGLNES
jgi:hypothetical protein